MYFNDLKILQLGEDSQIKIHFSPLLQLAPLLFAKKHVQGNIFCSFSTLYSKNADPRLVNGEQNTSSTSSCTDFWSFKAASWRLASLAREISGLLEWKGANDHRRHLLYQFQKYFKPRYLHISRWNISDAIWTAAAILAFDISSISAASRTDFQNTRPNFSPKWWAENREGISWKCSLRLWFH